MIVNLTGNNGGSGVDRQQVLDIVANSGFITEERDELFQNAPAAVITSGDISSWNLKANTEYVNMSDDMVLLSIAAQQVKDELFLASKSDIPDTSSFVSVEDYESLEESTANALKAHNDKFREYYKSTQIDTKLAAFANLNDIKNAVKEYSKLSKVEELEEVIAAALCNLNERLLALE